MDAMLHIEICHETDRLQLVGMVRGTTIRHTDQDETILSAPSSIRRLCMDCWRSAQSGAAVDIGEQRGGGINFFSLLQKRDMMTR
jgi:hypothetical protein